MSCKRSTATPTAEADKVTCPAWATPGPRRSKLASRERQQGRADTSAQGRLSTSRPTWSRIRDLSAGAGLLQHPTARYFLQPGSGKQQRSWSPRAPDGTPAYSHFLRPPTAPAPTPVLQGWPARDTPRGQECTQEGRLQQQRGCGRAP